MAVDWAQREIGNDDSRRKWKVEVLYPWRDKHRLFKYYLTREAARNFVAFMRQEVGSKLKYRVVKNV